VFEKIMVCRGRGFQFIAFAEEDVIMSNPEHHLTFGPVPSRRLGQSLGINNVIAKSCSYSCIYCQIGETTEKFIEPQRFFTPQEIYDAVAARLRQVREAGQAVDYLTFVPDGEPTLDSTLGESIGALRSLDIPIAVISNATLLWRDEVRKSLAEADLVSVKVDSVDEGLWHRINRPHHGLQLDTLLQGVRDFAAEYSGRLITDTMLIAGLNDTLDALTANADFIASLSPQAAYLAVPTRPTSVKGVHGTGEVGLLQAHQIFASRIATVELLSGHEVGTFAPSGNARDDLLAITAVHPMREDDVRQLLMDDGASWEVIEHLMSTDELIKLEYEGSNFYLRPVRCGRHHV
jgi:wyosine [tRNA(Phe)-imidazoG37] synthetase (radical SAM superfamily)